jgi:pyruvate dehydrogenase E1 component beta subunit
MPKQESSQEVTFAREILRVLDLNLASDPKVILAGLGVNDPKGVFGTTTGLHNKYGENRVVETPTSENAMTGIAIGLAISGFRPIVVHQRLDFFLLAMDQLVNSAAKWHYMFGGQQEVPLTIRLITGRGWGQGPTHSQNLHAWFAHIPGLKVVMPAFASDAAALLQASIDDPNPVIFIEDRWAHNQKCQVLEVESNKNLLLGQARKVLEGLDITVVASGYLSIEALKASLFLRDSGVNVDLIDLRTIKPIDEEMILESVKKTGRLLVIDSGSAVSSFANEILKISITHAFEYLKQAPETHTLPDVPEPTSYGVIAIFKISAYSIALKIIQMLNLTEPDGAKVQLLNHPADIPDATFTGPF